MAPIPKYAAKRDANEREIVSALRASGCGVVQLNKFDLLVSCNGKLYALDIKSSRGRPTESQEAIRAELERGGVSLHYVKSLDEVMEILESTCSCCKRRKI